MRSRRRTRLGLVVLVAGLSLFLGSASAFASKTLKGVFHISQGSYIRMQLPTGAYFSNPYSQDKNKTYTLISSPKGGGLHTGTVQNAPSPAFNAQGDSLASSIITPTNFTDIDFGVITKSPPTIVLNHGKLSGSDYGLYAEWNNQSFQQGTKSLHGTFKSSNRTFVIDWHTKVVGGAFAGYTGWWHLVGTFTPDS